MSPDFAFAFGSDRGAAPDLDPGDSLDYDPIFALASSSVSFSRQIVVYRTKTKILFEDSCRRMNRRMNMYSYIECHGSALHDYKVFCVLIQDMLYLHDECHQNPFNELHT
ncbi:hypothetical protein EVAR_74335_1 [Eumeta japonica]|uniref:Uncharacterized protein n=1 Tax=Eumeta variegata TaxID=151549 RepID=A0A4C1SFW3_EUMVA|nr:hypothetical protein EVAR_74335_1 [Eumeta japonica]